MAKKLEKRYSFEAYDEDDENNNNNNMDNKNNNMDNMDNSTMENNYGLDTFAFSHLERQDEGAFADLQNVHHAVSYLNNMLQVVGVLPPDKRFILKRGMTDEDAVVVANCMYELLQRGQRDTNVNEELRDRLRRVESERIRLQQLAQQQNNKITELERDLNSWQLRLEKMTHDIKKNEQRSKQLIDELQKSNELLLQRDSQSKHEIKKKEKEYFRLQEHLKQVVQEKNKESRTNMEFVNSITRRDMVGNSRQKWGQLSASSATTPTTTDELIQRISSAYEEKQRDILQENDELRRSLMNLQSELQNVLNGANSNITNEPMTMNNNVGLSNMPFGFVQGRYESNVKSQLNEIRVRLARIHRGTPTKNATIRELQSKIEEYERIVNDQQRLIRLSIATDDHLGKNENVEPISLFADVDKNLSSSFKNDNDNSNNNNIDNNNIIDDKNEEDELLEYQKQKEMFEIDRSKFLQQMQQLDAEKKKFQQEQKSIETFRLSSPLHSSTLKKSTNSNNNNNNNNNNSSKK